MRSLGTWRELLALSVNSRGATPVLGDLPHSEAAEVRFFAVFSIGELGLRGKEIAPEIVRRLLEMEAYSIAGVRAQLAHSLGKICHVDEALPAVLGCLKRLASDADTDVRRRESESLDHLSP
jgi:HEAT repeats